MRLPKDEDGNVLVNKEYTERFCVARPGAYLFALSNASFGISGTSKEDHL
jgi:hypothetical protein